MEFLQKKLDDLDFWFGQTAVGDLKMGVALCDQWQNACSILTSQMWTRLPTHSWIEGPYQSSFIGGFKQRLSEVINTTILF